MSDFNFGQHDEYHRGNRGRERFPGRRPYRARGNQARGQFHQTWAAENTASGQFHQTWMAGNTARGAEDEFDLASEDGTRDESENQRGKGRRRPRGSYWRGGRGKDLTTSEVQPLFAEGSFFVRTGNSYSEDCSGDQSENERGKGRRRPRGNYWRGGRGKGFTTSDNQPSYAEESFFEQTGDSYSEDGIGDQSENQRSRGRRRPRGRGSYWSGEERGEGFKTSYKPPSFAEESFGEQTGGYSDEYSPAAHGKSTGEQKTRSERRSSSGTSKAEQRTEGPAPDRSVRVDQNRILHYLINSHDGSCLVSDLRENHTLFEASMTPDAVLQALKQCKNVKVLRNGNNLDGSVVKAFIKSLRLCFQHRPPKPCQHPKCRHLHLCRDFLMDCCFMKNCVCSHDVESQQNEKVMNDCGVQIFSPDQQLQLIRCTTLMVCREHNSSEGCPDPDSCFKLHICNAYVMNKCLLLDELCSEGHDPFSERNRKILQLHEIEKLPKETIFKMLLAFRKQPQRNTTYAGNCSESKEVKPTNIQRRSVVEIEEDETEMKVPYEAPARPAAPVKPPVARNPNLVSFTDFVQRKVDSLLLCDVKSEDVCDAFEEHSCNLKENCTDRHKSRTPYLWRVKLSGQWISLDKENSAIERAFSDPDVEEYWAMESVPEAQLRLNFKDMNSDYGPIQRLSTPSYVEVRDKVDATRWLWYWHDGSKWLPYGQSGEPPHLDILEAKYQRDPKLICCFEFGSTLYELDFAKMEQKNLRTHYVRKVMRRPFNKERVEWAGASHIRFSDECHCDVSKLPTDWVPMDTESKGGTELIPLHSNADAYQRVAAGFFKTMDKTKHQIRRIYKVQNLDLWNNYETKKASIDKHMGGETEVNVFHGTAEEETTRWICGVGFDQRMHGVNGTVYGKGAYFATTAKYSHGYTQPSSRKFRYMFYAKITIGRVARGDSSLKRPPAIDPSNPNKGLYDSCANSLTDPSIYVIFDNNQTYPDYLIEYRDIHPDPLLDQSSSLQSQAYAQAFNRFQAANAATIQPTHAYSSSAQNPPSNPPPSNPPFYNPVPSNPVPSNPAPSNPPPSSLPPFNQPYSNPGPHPTSSQYSSARSKKELNCLVM